MIGRLLCRLGFHWWDPVCTIRQVFYWPDDGTYRGRRVAKECGRCRFQWIQWDLEQ